MKIAIFLTDITAKGGVPRVVSNLANNFVEKDNTKVDIVSFCSNNENTIPFYINDNVKVTHMNIDINKKCNKIKKQRDFVRIIKEYFSKENYDFIISTNAHFNIYLAICKKYIASKLIGCEHGEYNHLSKGWRNISKYFYKNLDSIVLLSEKEKTLFNEFSKKVVIIPNMNSFESEEESDLNSKRIISVGRIDDNKNIKDLIKAFYEVQKENKDWDLYIYGDGEKEDELKLKNQIEDLKLKDKIKMINFTENIKEEYLKASLFVMTSKSEGLPMVLIEAMNCGVPCISYDIKTGPSDIITNNEDGFLIKPFNIEELTNKIQYLTNNNDIRKDFGKRAKENSKRFNKDNIVNQWFKLFEEL